MLQHQNKKLTFYFVKLKHKLNNTSIVKHKLFQASGIISPKNGSRTNLNVITTPVVNIIKSKQERKELSHFFHNKHSSSNLSFKYSHLRRSSMKPTSMKKDRSQSSNNIYIDSHSKHVTMKE